MFGYYLELALRSLKRSKALTALMVLAVAMGIGACMTTLTVLHVVSGDPIPSKSHRLYYPQLEPRDTDNGFYTKGEPPDQISWQDGMYLLKARRANRQALMTGGIAPVQLPGSNLEPFFARARYTTADFFPMFEVPMRYGHAWSEKEDEARSRIAVISTTLNERLFHGEDSTGKTVRYNGMDLQVVGVIDPWRAHPRFYDLNDSYADAEELFIPLTTSRDLKGPRNGSRDCWGQGGKVTEDALETANCTWLQLWVEIDDPARVADYKAFMTHYSQDQVAVGRFHLPPNVRLRDVLEWLDYNHVVPSDVHLQVWLALGFFAVCLVNTVGLMLAKFLRRSSEIGVRRALGASRANVFAQLLIEAGMIGLTGGIAGLLMALGGLWLVRQQPDAYASLAHLDMPMLAATFAIAIGATLIAGLLPAWRACQVTPALQLKSP
ncbi:ABC transporter permease [Luteibacter aegosomatissinici]|uniref:ABC transporter permease n=1 Tax=Luteibacter aegosomatissinici TaxID=2911539 RepID=UPI001FF779AE|nr:ABC transporter permease [Luteibacter aegosomatissinici]UPG93432.1 ABC transporter permease [Luteibacter aegosomatissinici]